MLQPTIPRWSVRSAIKGHLVPLALLFILTALSYPWWLHSQIPNLDDLAHLNVPQRMLLGWFYRHGTLPLWNPFNFAGQPFLAAGQSGPLYLPNVLFIWLPIVIALKLSYLCHAWLAAFGMYAAIYHVHRNRIGALVGALSFVTCGFLLGHLIHTQMFDAMCYLPLLFWLLLRLLDVPSWQRVGWLSVAIAFEIYAGHPQISFYAGLLLGGYFILSSVSKPRRIWRQGLALLAAFAWGCALSAPQWLVTLNLVSYSNRSHTNARFLLANSDTSSMLTQFLTPYSAGGGLSGVAFSVSTFEHLYGTPLYWEFTSYVGIIALCLAISTCLVRWRTPVVYRLGLLGILFLCLALGSSGPFSTFLTHTPGFDLFRVPARYIGLVDFTVAFLAGSGVSTLAVPHDQHGTDAITMLPTTSRSLWSVFPIVTLLTMLTLTLFASRGILRLAPAHATQVGLTMLLLTLFVTISGWRSRWQQPAVAVLACLMLFDSVTQGAAISMLPLGKTAPYADSQGTTAYVKAHLPHNDPFLRVAELRGTSLILDESAAMQIPTVNGYDSLVPTWYTQYVNLTWSSDTLLSRPLSILELLGVKYVISDAADPHVPTQTLGMPAWSTTLTLPSQATAVSIAVSGWTGADVSPRPLMTVVWQNGQHVATTAVAGKRAGVYTLSLPPQWPTSGKTKVTLENEQWNDYAVIQSLSVHTPGYTKVYPANIVLGPIAWKQVYQFGNEVVWENPDPVNAAWEAPTTHVAGFHPVGQVRLAAWTANRQVWHAQGNGGDVVISQMYDPNWHATVDGQPAPVLRVDGFLTGVPLAAGAHTVILSYWPPTLTYGLIAFAIGLLAFVAMWLRAWRRRRRRRRRRAGG